MEGGEDMADIFFTLVVGIAAGIIANLLTDRIRRRFGNGE